MLGPEPIDDHGYLVRLYGMVGTALETQERHELRLCSLESWRNKLIGIGIAVAFLMPVATAITMKFIG